MINFVISKIISSIKGEHYILDESIPTMYILRELSSKILSLVYGMVRLRTFKIVFVHPTAKIRGGSRLFFGKGFMVGRNCFIDCLSKQGAVFGRNVSMGDYTFIRLTGSLKEIANGIVIGDNVGLGTHGYYGCGVGTLHIGNDCILGNYVSIHPENHNFNDLNSPIRLQGVNSVGGGICGR